MSLKGTPVTAQNYGDGSPSYSAIIDQFKHCQAIYLKIADYPELLIKIKELNDKNHFKWYRVVYIFYEKKSYMHCISS